MIAALHIENIAVIRSADVDFNPGFTVFTGETGAGKSLLLDSINLLLGARASRELIRSGCERAFVSAIFSGLSEKTQKLLAENDFSADENGCITLSRSVFSDGKSQTKLNGRTITVAFQKELAPMLLTVHGQHDSGALLDFSSYREYVDAYAENGELLSDYTSAFA
ncbi:MAG: AAA family ATPase, partial [Firmicutes bacterium]|nr:AAA family ATPase [Bacillota bacterium]